MYLQLIQRCSTNSVIRHLTRLYHTNTVVSQQDRYNYDRSTQQSRSTPGTTDSLEFISATALSSTVRPGGRQSYSGITATVYGATGFLGRYVVHNLGRIGSQVVVPYRGDGFNTRHLRLAGDLGQIIPIPYEFNDYDSVKQTMKRSNVVVNCIGRSYDTANYSIDDSNVKLTYQLVRAAKDQGVERFIHISHINADMNSSSQLYRAKAEAEQIVRYYYPDATILRSSTIYGAEDKFINYYVAMGKNLFGVPVTRNGDKLYTPVFVLDVARAVMNSIIYGEAVGKTYTLSGDTMFTEQQICDLISDNCYFNIRTIPMPEFAMKLYANILSGNRFGNKILNHLRAPSWYNLDMIEQAKYDELVSSDALTLNDLGIVPTPLLTQLKTLLISHSGDRGPDRFEKLDVKPSTAQSL